MVVKDLMKTIIICSFISSNSSFTECVRKHLISSPSHMNPDCDTECHNENFGSMQASLDASFTYTFDYCSWEDCIAEPGGAISSNTEGVSLTVIHCTFTRCNSTSYENPRATQSYNGGALCVNGIKELIVSTSRFFRCCAPQTNNDNGGSGGMYVVSITTLLVLSSSDFISCFTGASGGGAYFASIKTSDVGPQTVMSCRFVRCKSEGNTPDGGGLCLWGSDYTLGLSNCLFSECSVTTNCGGGLDFTFSANPDPHPIRCCFFNDNSAPDGNDVNLRSLPSNLEPFLFCFSTTSRSQRIGGVTNKDDDWLPLACPMCLVDSSNDIITISE